MVEITWSMALGLLVSLAVQMYRNYLGPNSDEYDVIVWDLCVQRTARENEEGQ